MRAAFSGRLATAAVVVLALLMPVPAGAAEVTDSVVTPEVLPSTTGSGEISFIGHGWGHGRGMGQYGALGYAVDHGWSYQQILAHYYSNTQLSSDAGNPAMSVELSRLNGKDTIVQGYGLTVNGQAVGSGYGYLRVRKVGTSTFEVDTATSCAGPWTARPGQLGTGLTIATTGSQTDVRNLLRTCEVGISYGYRGMFQVVATNGTQYTFNWLEAESYLRGVVPRESPASWGTLGGGKGMQALAAQAVAARSYARASSPRASGASVCDTTACQVYFGAFKTTTDGYDAPREALEQATTDAAVAQTAGQVMRFTSNGAIARTEFSSSTGGWTVGGTFPAVQDLGDAISLNPNHTWTTTFSETEVAAKLGLSGVRSVTVTQRNGLGDLGGRVLTVVVVDGAGVAHSYSGGTFRSALGTDRFKSDWFAVTSVNRAEAEQVVKALYRDVLARSVDPAGLDTWTTYIMSTGDTAGLVRQIATSRERMARLVTAQYRSALNRAPESAGLDHWIAYLQSGRGVYELQIGVYGSPESLATLGDGDVATWVGALYARLLGRSSSAAERDYWAGVAAREGREAVVAGIAKSPECTLRRLDDYYLTFLLRRSDAAGRATFLPMMTGRGDFDIPVHLGSSAEYWARAQTRVF